MALALMAGVGGAAASSGAASSSTKPSSASKVKGAPQKMDSKKAFEIPGLQARPYHDDELQVAFEIIDLDRHGEIGATDLRRALQLCGEPEPTDAEVQEMIRLMDPDGSGSIAYDEFRRYFVEPPPLFRNFDLHRRGGEAAEEEEVVPELPALDDGDATPSAIRLESRKKKFTIKEQSEGDPRAPCVKVLAKHGITPEFIRDVYQTFVEIDTKETGFMSFEAFCKVFSQKPSEKMREVFDAFDAEREGVGSAAVRHRAFHVLPARVSIQRLRNLQMYCRCAGYQELLKLEMLHEHQPSFFTIFVSHQWLAGAHPDPSSNQFRNLQKALRKVLDGTIRLELDMTSQFLGHQKTLTLQDRALLKDAYVSW
ncbi:unnamed protein product [Cladocopium goreaui]|uniref:EF-hand domain-containing protein n=1 Tax=Cladocopium goreaui TaxID=2562237 RepID=A0A9P1BJP1_9DINO|nr:unnamed protein product [Cladocopium goreaui]